MQIPHHYMHGSNGPTNPAEAEATRTYGAFEHRITAGMNQWVATGNQAEAQCALAQLDAWAQAKALTNYDPKAYSQSWFQAEWSLASAGVTASVLRQNTALDPAQQERVAKWLRNAAHQLISYEKPGELGNNHHYWRALAAISIGVASNDNELFRFGVNTFKQAVGQEDNNGAFPLEMARHENAIHYQAFALQPLIMIAEFAERQNVDLYAYTDTAAPFATPSPSSVRPSRIPASSSSTPPTSRRRTSAPATSPSSSSTSHASALTSAPSSLRDPLHNPATATRVGGNTTVLAGNNSW